MFLFNIFDSVNNRQMYEYKKIQQPKMVINLSLRGATERFLLNII